MVKNTLIELTIENFGFDGEGVAKYEGKPIFVKNALPNEKVLAKIIYVNKNFARAIIDKLIVPSPYRIVPKCELFGKCGGCKLQHLDYDEQLNFKRQSVEQTFHKIASIDINAEETYPSPLIYNYRNKISMPIRQLKDGVRMGFYRENSHDLIEVTDCHIENKANKDIRDAVKTVIAKENLTGYDESTGRGQIRHIVARVINNKPYITIVLNEAIPDNAKGTLDSELKCRFDSYALYINYNTLRSNIILGDRFEFVGGFEGMEDVNGFMVSIHPNSFFQVNDGVRQALYDEVIAVAGSGKVVVDAYSGAGLMTAMLSRNFDRAIGIEVVKEAHQAAEQLKSVNNISNMVNICGDCAQVFPDLNVTDAVTVLDPPRSGCDQKVLKAAARFSHKIVYVSCNAATLARDAIVLTQEGFSLNTLKPFDMFPQTQDVEVLAVFVKE